jgi:hypothetical protein
LLKNRVLLHPLQGCKPVHLTFNSVGHLMGFILTSTY